MHQRDRETPLFDLFQDGTKDAQLPFCEGTVRSICVCKVSHDSLDVEGIF